MGVHTFLITISPRVCPCPCSSFLVLRRRVDRPLYWTVIYNPFSPYFRARDPPFHIRRRTSLVVRLNSFAAPVNHEGADTLVSCYSWMGQPDSAWRVTACILYIAIEPSGVVLGLER
jgi:hypothetical protein